MLTSKHAKVNSNKNKYFSRTYHTINSCPDISAVNVSAWQCCIYKASHRETSMQSTGSQADDIVVMKHTHTQNTTSCVNHRCRQSRTVCQVVLKRDFLFETNKRSSDLI